MFTDKVNKFFVISEVLWITVKILRKKIKKYNNPILPSLGRSNAFFLVLFSCLDTQNGTASESDSHCSYGIDLANLIIF